jgi:hypothetical protein
MAKASQVYRLLPVKKNEAVGIAAGASLLAAIAVLLFKTPRQKVVAAAMSQVGKSDASPYWRDTLGNESAPKEWCGAFALWALHRAKLAHDVMWAIGKGFLYRLPQTKEPKPGDIAYKDQPNQHHAVVEYVTPTQVGVINGNGLGGKVTRSVIARNMPGVTFFSIEPLV